MPRKSRKERDLQKNAIMKQLLDYYQPKTVAEMQEMLKDLLKDALQDGLEAELEEELGYERYDTGNKQTDNSRNGHTTKTVRSSMGQIELDVPRGRDGEFEPQIVPRYQRDISDIRDESDKHVCFGPIYELSTERLTLSLRTCPVVWKIEIGAYIRKGCHQDGKVHLILGSDGPR